MTSAGGGRRARVWAARDGVFLASMTTDTDGAWHVGPLALHLPKPVRADALGAAALRALSASADDGSGGEVAAEECLRRLSTHLPAGLRATWHAATPALLVTVAEGKRTAVVAADIPPGDAAAPRPPTPNATATAGLTAEGLGRLLANRLTGPSRG